MFDISRTLSEIRLKDAISARLATCVSWISETLRVITWSANCDCSCSFKIIPWISIVDCWVFTARERTSSATTANPRPCSPARAASIAAFRASKLVWSDILLMTSVTELILSENSRNWLIICWDSWIDRVTISVCLLDESIISWLSAINFWAVSALSSALWACCITSKEVHDSCVVAVATCSMSPSSCCELFVFPSIEYVMSVCLILKSFIVRWEFLTTSRSLNCKFSRLWAIVSSSLWNFIGLRSFIWPSERARIHSLICLTPESSLLRTQYSPISITHEKPLNPAIINWISRLYVWTICWISIIVNSLFSPSISVCDTANQWLSASLKVTYWPETRFLNRGFSFVKSFPIKVLWVRSDANTLKFLSVIINIPLPLGEAIWSPAISKATLPTMSLPT